jgi:hypothetical protein
MNSLRYFVGKKNKLSYILKKADALGFTDMNVDNNAFKTLALIRDYCFEPRVQNKLEYLSITLDFREFMYFMDNEEKMYNWFQGVECEMTHVDLDVYTIDFIYHLNDLMNNNKLIYLFINFDGYGVDEDEMGHYACHSVCGIFIPMGKGIYKFNYINSHGDAMKTTDYLEHRLSSTRVKKIKFKEPVDVILMRSFIKFINKNIETHNHIIYKGNELDTYYGVNLQSGDDHGICFVIPFLLYYYLGNNYYKPFDKTNDLFSSASKLLKENRVMDFVHYSFVDFHPEFKFIMINSVWLKERLALLEKCLQKSGFRFIKDITNTLVSFMGQSYFQKKIINTY